MRPRSYILSVTLNLFEFNKLNDAEFTNRVGTAYRFNQPSKKAIK
jgi:hypothetical protein